MEIYCNNLIKIDLVVLTFKSNPFSTAKRLAKGLASIREPILIGADLGIAVAVGTADLGGGGAVAAATGFGFGAAGAGALADISST